MDQEKLVSFGNYDPAINPILFHYCDLDTFLSIIQNRTLRFSDLNTMNDFSEGHWAYDRFVEAVNAALSAYPNEFFEDLDIVFSQFQLKMLPTISCFSTDGDVLSQWRAYADDGKGISVGFSGKKLMKLATKIGKVVYQVDQQVEFFGLLMAFIFPVWQKSKKAKSKQTFQEALLLLLSDASLMKNPAFQEEKEVRLVRMLNPYQENGVWVLEDNGGTAAHADSESDRKRS